MEGGLSSLFLMRFPFSNKFPFNKMSPNGYYSSAKETFFGDHGLLTEHLNNKISIPMYWLFPFWATCLSRTAINSGSVNVFEILQYYNNRWKSRLTVIGDPNINNWNQSKNWRFLMSLPWPLLFIICEKLMSYKSLHRQQWVISNSKIIINLLHSTFLFHVVMQVHNAGKKWKYSLHIQIKNLTLYYNKRINTGCLSKNNPHMKLS